MNWIEWLQSREAIPSVTPLTRSGAVISTVGTWDKTSRIVQLPDRWMAARVGPGNLIIRLGLQQVDIPPRWEVDTGVPAPAPTPPPLPIPDGMVELVAMHNTFRASQGKAPFVAEARLMRAAQDYADTMAQWGVLSHIGPDGSTPWDRMERAGYKQRQASENIATGQTSNQEVMDDWENSPGHRADILGPYRDIGVGMAGNPIFWVADFGSQ